MERHNDFYEVRVPTQQELELVRELRHKVLDPARSVESDNELSEADFSADTIHYAAFCDGILISTVRIDFVTDGEEAVYEVRKMATDPEFRHRGIGAEVLRAAEDLAVKRGARKLRLDSREESIRFYQHAGYRLVGDGEVQEDGVLNYPMVKRIAQP